MLCPVEPGETRVVPLDLFGARVDVAIAGDRPAELDAVVRRTWSRCLATDASAPAEATVAVSGDDETVLLDQLSTRLTQEALALRVGRLLLLHACAVADPRTGATMVLVAPSGVGKTTAAATLGRRFGYVSDETAAIDAYGRVLAYPKPLSVLIDGRRPKRQIPPDELGLLPAPSALHLTAVALLARTPGVTRPRVSTPGMLEALPAVAEQSSSLYLLPRPLRSLAATLERVGGLRRVEYAEADDLPDVVADLLGAGPLGAGA